MAPPDYPLTPIVYSPLAGCSDVPYRLMARRHGHRGLVFCEMVKMEALVRDVPETLSYLEYLEEMRPIGAQIVGSRPELAAQCAKKVEELGFDVVDFNCGCPVDKVTKDGSGSSLLREPERIGEILSNMCAAVNIPVTVKIRIGWDHNSINAPQVVSIAEQAGAQMISIHGRTRQQGYEGKANRDVIAEAVKAAKTIKVGGNGDIFDIGSALHMFAHTGCDAILCARGAMGQPWIGHDIERALQGLPPLLHDPLEALLEHIELITEYRPERKHPYDIRRVACWYCKNFPHTRALREKLARVEDAQTARQLVADFRNQLASSHSWPPSKLSSEETCKELECAELCSDSLSC